MENTQENYIEKDNKYLLQLFNKPDVIIESGNGVTLTDINGKTYTDFVGGIAVNLFGYNNLELNTVIEKQAKKIIHISNLYHNIPQIELAEILVKNSLKNGKVYFSNSGTEANEGALKFSKIYGIKTKGALGYEIISTHKSFHGRSIGSLSITGQPHFFKNLGPVVNGISFVEYGNIDSLKKVINKNTAALFLEPVQAEGGIIQATKEYWKEVRELCNKYDTLLVIDEVQTGMCRTGSLFAYQQLGITPDIITLAKGLGVGYPMGAIIVNDKVASKIDKGMHGGTIGGNPMATAIGKFVINKLINENFESKVNKISKYFINKLEGLISKTELFVKVKGKGLLLGIELNNGSLLPKFMDSLREKGFLVARAGTNVLRFIPPLVITEKDIDGLVVAIEEVVNKIKGK